MKNVLELQKQKKVKVEEARSILTKTETEKRAMSQEERTKYDSITSEIESINETIVRAEKQNKLEMDSPDIKVIKDAGDQDFRSFGEFLIAVRKAYDPSIRQRDARLDRLEVRATGMNEAIGSEGGFVVEKQNTDALLKRSYETGILASRVQRIPITVGNGIKIPYIDETSRATGSRYGGIQAYWVNESGTPTKSKPKLGKLNLELKKLMAICYTTDELLEDAPALEAVVKQAFVEELSWMLDEAILNGTGAGCPQGIMVSNALVSITKETGQAAKTIVADNIIKMWARCYGKARQNAIWLINQDIEPQLHKLNVAVGTGGIPVFMPANGLSSSPYSTLYGRPVIPVEHCQTLGTKGDIVLADLSEYLMIEKGGVKADASVHVQFLYDEMTYRFIYRADGQSKWQSALTPAKGSNTLSPFVSLDTRS